MVIYSNINANQILLLKDSPGSIYFPASVASDFVKMKFKLCESCAKEVECKRSAVPDNPGTHRITRLKRLVGGNCHSRTTSMKAP